MEKSKIEQIKEWIEKCPLLKGGKINVNYLKDKPQSYSIDQTPVNPIVKQYVDGGTIKQIAFDFSVTAPISSQAIVNLANSKFCEDFMEWVNIQNRKKDFPNIKGVFSIMCTSPRIYFTKNRNNGSLYYSDELPILWSLRALFFYKEEK